MVLLVRSDAVIELGRKLVAELGLGEDLLGSWMAHHIARLMDAAETASSSEKAVLEGMCAREILELWRYRDSLPRQPQPLRDMKPILQTLASLDVAQPGYRYAQESLREAALAGTEGQTRQWLDVAFGVDFTARMLIAYSLRSAASHAASEAAPWVALAEKAGASEDELPVVIRFILNSDPKPDDIEEEKASLKDKLERLAAFTRLATLMADDLREQIDSRATKSDRSQSGD